MSSHSATISRTPPADAGSCDTRCDAESDSADLSGALVIDAAGNVVAATRSIADLLGIPAKSLLQVSFAELFAPATASAESAEATADWKSMCTAMMDRWVSVTARPADAAPRMVRVRLERAFGGAGTYIAVLRPPTQSR